MLIFFSLNLKHVYFSYLTGGLGALHIYWEYSPDIQLVTLWQLLTSSNWDDKTQTNGLDSFNTRIFFSFWSYFVLVTISTGLNWIFFRK